MHRLNNSCCHFTRKNSLERPIVALNGCHPSIYGVDSCGGLGQLIHVLNRKRVAKKLASRLRQLRVSKGLSQEDLAFEAKLGRSYYWRVEQGLINVTLETLVKLGNALKVEIADLFKN